jgi:DoxX.
MSLPADPEANARLLLVFKRVARFCLAFIWIYLGFVPKLLTPLPFEQEVVRKTGLYFSSPELTIRVIGIFEIALGIWLLTGIKEKLACLVTSGFLIVLMIIAVIVEPMLLAGPFGGIAKNSAVLVLAWMIWRIASLKEE